MSGIQSNIEVYPACKKKKAKAENYQKMKRKIN